jgi:hypothetical protein
LAGGHNAENEERNMVARPILNELDVNAIVGALDERTERLAVTVARLQAQPTSDARTEALDNTYCSLRDAVRAKLKVIDAAEHDYPGETTYESVFVDEPPKVPMFEGMGDYTEPELREQFGK